MDVAREVLGMRVCCSARFANAHGGLARNMQRQGTWAGTPSARLKAPMFQEGYASVGAQGGIVMHQMLGKPATTNCCTHDDICLRAGKDEHLIECNECGRWWRCYGELADAWSGFTRYGRMDGSEPSTVNIMCSPQAWPNADGAQLVM